MRDDRAYLEDILEAIQRIEKYASRGREAFQADELIQNWIVHHIQIIGEATGKVSEEFRDRHPEVPWVTIKAMRNVLVHFYFGVDLGKVWRTVVEDLPVLKSQVTAILRDLGGQEARANQDQAPRG
jgi:uncharacterized protein with HEPN domain